MRIRTALVGPALLLLLAAAAFAADTPTHPNFAGVWELDQTRSHSIPPDMKQTMTVTQEGDRVSVELKVVTPQGERVIKEAYTLDGKETEFAPPAPPNAPKDAPPPKGKRTAHWMPNGKGFIIDPEGKIAKVFLKVKPSVHSEEVLAALAELRRPKRP